MTVLISPACNTPSLPKETSPTKTPPVSRTMETFKTGIPPKKTIFSNKIVLQKTMLYHILLFNIYTLGTVEGEEKSVKKWAYPSFHVSMNDQGWGGYAD